MYMGFTNTHKCLCVAHFWVYAIYMVRVPIHIFDDGRNVEKRPAVVRSYIPKFGVTLKRET